MLSPPYLFFLKQYRLKVKDQTHYKYIQYVFYLGWDRYFYKPVCLNFMPTLLFTQNHLLALFFNFHVDLNTFEISGSHPFISLYIRAAGYQKGKNLPWTGYRQYRLGYTQVSLLSSTLASKTYEKAGQYQDSRDYIATAAAAKLLQSCPSLCDPIDGSPSGSPVPGILQARTLEWGAISFSNA